MKSPGRMIVMLALLMTWATAPLAATEDPAAGPLEWPRTILATEGKILLYQPQPEKLADDRLHFRLAVGVTPTGSERQHYGAVNALCRLDIDKQARTADCYDFQIVKMNFPTAAQGVNRLEEILDRHLVNRRLTVSLDRLMAGLEMTDLERKKSRDPGYKFTAPVVYVALEPTVLVIIDGEPELRPLEGTDLMQVINTVFIIVQSTGTKSYYLWAEDRWMTADDIKGKWRETDEVPESVRALEEKTEETAKDQGMAEKKIERAPEIIVSTVPAELIQLNGEPQMAPIEGTDLLRVTNTDDQIIMDLKEQKHFILRSGRWYSASQLKTGAEWTFVPPDKLPASFSDIPRGSKAADVLSSIPGTPESEEAAIQNHIPQTATVKRDEATLEVVYDGEPQFEYIKGTDMAYAVNTSYSVIRIRPRYYCCHQAVWFVSDKPTGPWAVADTIPAEIYDIPSSYPVYPVTYTYIYRYDPHYVYVGYYPGYLGSYYWHGTVIYGTGYRYRGWYGRWYYGRPVTWGFGFRYNSYTGWSVGVRWGRPGWYGHGLSVGVRVSDGKVVAGGVRVGGPAGWNAGWFGVRRGAAFDNNVNISREFNFNHNVNINNSQNIYNRWNGKTVTNDWNQDRVQRFTNADLPGGGDARQELQERGVTREGGRQELSRNNVYAGKDGNVYRREGDRDWQKASSKGWQNMDQSRGDYQNRSRELDRQQQSRERGSQRYTQQRSSSARRGSGGFSGNRVSRRR